MSTSRTTSSRKNVSKKGAKKVVAKNVAKTPVEGEKKRVSTATRIGCQLNVGRTERELREWYAECDEVKEWTEGKGLHVSSDTPSYFTVFLETITAQLYTGVIDSLAEEDRKTLKPEHVHAFLSEPSNLTYLLSPWMEDALARSTDKENPYEATRDYSTYTKRVFRKVATEFPSASETGMKLSGKTGDYVNILLEGMFETLGLATARNCNHAGRKTVQVSDVKLAAATLLHGDLETLVKHECGLAVERFHDSQKSA
jgi:histone H3/H4